MSLSHSIKLVCTKYLAPYPGRVITSDRLVFLVTQVWLHSLTTVNIMSRFRKVWHINSSEITDHVCYQTGTESDDVPTIPLFSSEKEDLYKKRYKEGYNVDDPNYTAWLKSTTRHLSVVSIHGPHPQWSIDWFQSPSSRESSAAVFSDVLVLPHPTDGAKECKPALNSRAMCWRGSNKKMKRLG